MGPGSQLENSVLMNLVYGHQLTYFQTKSGGKIDFVLDNEIGLEVKQTATAHHLSVLRKRLQAANLTQGFIVSLEQGLSQEQNQRVINAWNL